MQPRSTLSCVALRTVQLPAAAVSQKHPLRARISLPPCSRRATYHIIQADGGSAQLGARVPAMIRAVWSRVKYGIEINRNIPRTDNQTHAARFLAHALF